MISLKLQVLNKKECHTMHCASHGCFLKIKKNQHSSN